MTYNISALPVEEQEKIEVDKAAAYAVWKQRNGDLASAELDVESVDPKWRELFLSSIEKYRKK